MHITFWGVRGSIAVAGAAFARTGGHTTCLEIESDGHRLIIDAGTGIRALGEKLAHPVRATLLFTHLHWDHIQGFPFFAPAFSGDNELDLLGPVDDDGVSTLEHVLGRHAAADVSHRARRDALHQALPYGGRWGGARA